MQVSALTKVSLIPQAAKKAIEAYLLELDVGLAVTAPEASGHDLQSSGVVVMLEKLLDKFTAERTTLEKEEMNANKPSRFCLSPL